LGRSARVSPSDAACRIINCAAGTGITTGRVAGASINTGRVVDARDSQECDVRSQEYSTPEKPVLTKIVRVLGVAYDPTEFTPLVLHFINELAPPMTEKRFV